MKLITKIIFIFFFVLTNFTSASENYFSEGKELFEQGKYEDSKESFIICKYLR